MVCVWISGNVIFCLSHLTSCVKFQLLCKQDYWLAKKMYFQSKGLNYSSSFVDCGIGILKCCEHPYLPPQSHLLVSYSAEI